MLLLCGGSFLRFFLNTFFDLRPPVGEALVVGYVHLLLFPVHLVLHVGEKYLRPIEVDRPFV